MSHDNMFIDLLNSVDSDDVAIRAGASHTEAAQEDVFDVGGDMED